MRATEALYKAKKSKRKFRVIIKVAPDKFVKYRSNSREKFVEFLKKKYPGAMWANFYNAQGANIGSICATWGRHKGLIIN